MTTFAILGVVFGLMLAEAWISRRNERVLRQLGAVEPPDDVFRMMQVLYPAAFLVPAVEGWLRTPPQPWWWPAGLTIFVLAKGLKYWAIRTLGRRWSFKVLVPPGSQRTRRGPYRWMDHPNYLAVAGEILGAAFLLGGAWSGIVFTILFGSLMLRRIQVEERALS